MKTRKPETIDDYLSDLSDDKRTALTKLRKEIKAAAPKAVHQLSAPSFPTRWKVSRRLRRVQAPLFVLSGFIGDRNFQA